VRFAYQLRGLDPDWIDAGTRRIALYSRVPPGTYRFHVRAANDDGVWNQAGATLDIKVLPHFYQTLAFQLALVGAFALSLAGIHRLRLGRVEARFALVMKERNRIGREIHDTLAQGLAGIGLHLSAIEQEQSASLREQHVETARRLVKASLAEARRSVWDLRPEYLDRGNLVSGLTRMSADISEGGDVRIDVCTWGTPRPVSTHVETNVFRIAQEAVANAIRHAAARRIRVDLHFDRDAVQLTVADDGRGFDPATTPNGLGSSIMRDRAAQIGASLRVDSSPGDGTSVTLTLPIASTERSRVTRLPANVWSALRDIGTSARRLKGGGRIP
jgi:signal transduction histidine kinase